MQWQRTYPQEDGVYWFWGGQTGYPGYAPTIVQVWGDIWYTIAEGGPRSANEFPGYCAGPLVPPPLHQDVRPDGGACGVIEDETVAQLREALRLRQISAETYITACLQRAVALNPMTGKPLMLEEWRR